MSQRRELLTEFANRPLLSVVVLEIRALWKSRESAMPVLSLSYPLWKMMTSTVGLVVTANGDSVNIQSAEWTYMVAKSPLTVAVVIHESNLTHELLVDAQEFNVTLCSDSQADLADFCGSFSGRDVAKGSSDLLDFGLATYNKVPWAMGGVVALECT